MVANLLAFHLFLTAFLFLVVGRYVLDRRQASAAAIPFWIAMFLLAIFSMLAGLDVLNAPLESKILLMRLRLSILPFAVVAILVATIENAQRASLINKSRIGLLCVIPGLNLLFVWLPALSDSVRSNYQIVKSADFLSTLRYDNGPWFWVLLSYSILLALALFGIQFVTLLNSKGIYFKQTLLLSIGQIVPAVLIALLATGRLLFNGYNYGPHVLMLTALLNGWALYRYQWKLTAPIARDIALDLMNEIMLVANESGNLSDANASARRTLAISDQDMGKSLSHFIPSWDEIQAEAGSRESLRREIGLTRQNIKKMYELTVNPARSADPQNITAYVLIMREVTEQIRQKEQVQNLTRAVSQSPNSVLITDPNGIIEYVNPSFTRLTGYSPEEAIGKKTSLLKSGLTPEKVYQEMWQTIKAGRLWKEDMLNRRKDGEVYWEETLIAPLFDQYGQIVNYISIKEDVSARKEIDEILHRRLDELMMVNTISMAAASQLDLGSLVSLVGQQLEQSFNVRSVLIALHSNGAEYIEVPYWTIDRKRVSPPPLQYGEGLVSHILKTRQPLLISSDFRATAPKFGHKAIFAEKYGYPKTWLGVPVISGQQTVGVISLQNYTDEFAYSDDDVRLLNTIAASIGVAIDNARLFRATQEEIEERIRAEQESRERAVQMSVLYEIGHSLTKEIELEAVLNSLMEKCKQIAPIDVFAVGLHDQEAKQVKFIKFNDRGEEKENLVLDETSEEYILNEAIQRGVTIHLSNCGKESKYQGHPLHNNSQPVQSCLAIPLFHGNEVTGILAVQSYQPKAFSPEQIQTLEIVASQAAIAIDNARLYDVARRRADEMTLLYEASLELSANLDTDQVLRNLLEKCRQFLAMDSFYVSIYDEANHLIYYPLFYDRGDFTTLPARDLRVSPGLTGEVIMSAKTLYLPDTNDPQIIAQYQIIHIGGTPTRSFLGVPMIVRTKVVGVISIQSYLPNHYNQDQIRLIETIARQAAIAVENSRLYEAARHEILERRDAQENLQQTNQELQVQLKRVESLQEELRERAIRDSLTGLFNRRYLDESFPKKINRMKKKESALAVIMLDIDHFKLFNDTHGHTAGDELLAVLGQLLRNQTRQSDIACRYGGEEFVILLADTSLEVAAKRAEGIRKAFEETQIRFEEKSLQATISIGISIYPDHGDQPEALIIQADQALYQAKSSGRNCVVAWRK